MRTPHHHEVRLGLLVISALVILGWMTSFLGAWDPLRESTRVDVRLPDAMGLDERAVVKVAGVPIGSVTRISIDHNIAVVEMALSPDARIREDALARVRARSLLGEKYLEVIPQSDTAPVVSDGATLQPSGDGTEIDQLVNDLGPIVASVDPEALRAALDAMTEALAEDPERAGRMLSNLDQILADGAASAANIPTLITEATEASRAVRNVADQATPLLEDLRRVSGKAETVLGDLETVTSALPATQQEADALLTDTRAAVAEGRVLLGRLESQGDNIETILDNVAEIDRWEVRRWLREEGIKVRLRESPVEPSE